VKRIPIGLAGYGKIARDQHEAAIAASEDFALVAIADPATAHGALPSYSGIGAMLEACPEIEAVALCMPPRHRAQAARTALRAGRHVLLEKPPCANMAEARELVDLARQAGVTLYTAWHSQHGAAVDRARRWLEAAAIRSVTVNWKEDVRVWHPGQAWIWQEGGFGVFDPGINALSVLSALLPDELQVLDAELAFPNNCATPIAAKLRLQGAAGLPVTAEFDFRQVGPQSWDIDVDTDRGLLTLANGANRLAVDGVELEVGEEAEYRAIYARFAALVRGGESEVDLAPLALVEHALRNGRAISVEPFEERA
jgi:D-galactose 1-dehydrogenase